ncbi:MAG: ABC transporter permease [Anaerolineae bacterium]|nr:ABC transporter permease [Anaerolineae bacterium]
MTTTSPTYAPPVPVTSWRERIKITRLGFFAVCFILLGAWVLISAPRNIGPNVTTLLTVDATGIQGITVPTLGFSIVVALLYVAGGIFALLPVPAFKRFKFWWLVINGLLLIPLMLIIIAAGSKTNITVMFTESFRLSTPIIMGALAGLWAESSGVTNIAIEGMMLTGACLGFVIYTLMVTAGVSLGTAQFVGIVAAVIAGGVMAALHAWLSITFKTNQVVSGTVINILAIGLTSYLRREVLVSSQAAHSTLSPVAIPGLINIPVVGTALFDGKPIFYSMIVLVVVSHIVLYYTRWGLRTRAVGENPHAADTLGIDVIRNRWTNVIISGMIAGLAGAWFTLETTGSFDDQMTSGKGFIALAAMIFGNWTPFGAAAGGLLFGFSEALGQRFQFLGVPIPAQFLQMVPYLVTIIVLAGLIGKATSPKADGVPFEKE